jgi:hypothetical protein
MHEVESQTCILDVVGRLQQYLRNRWKKFAMDHKREKDQYPDFAAFVQFVEREAEEATDPVYGGTKSSNHSDGKVKNFSSQVNKPKSGGISNCILCKGEHRLFGCSVFRSMKPHERLKIVNENKLCENCLLSNHSTLSCKKPTVCSVPGCGKKHTKFLHVNPQVGRNYATSSQNSENVLANLPGRVLNANTCTGDEVHMPIVNVIVNARVEACALLDTASSNSFCSRSLVQSLGIEGRKISYSLNTMSKSNESMTSDVVDLTLVSADGSYHLKLTNVLVTDQIPVFTSQIDRLKVFPHLRDLPFVPAGRQVEILLGQDNVQALVPLEVRSGSEGEPFAARTVFGWTVNGPSLGRFPVNKNVISHFVCTSSLEDKVQTLWNIENEGLSLDEVSWSQDDKCVIELWNREICLVDGHYESPIPWKPDAVVPNNFVVALSRFKSLQKQLSKRGLLERYESEIHKLVQNGYAELVPEGELQKSDCVWYLPHQAVITDKKPGKLRLVFDCSSKFCGESLNDKCFQGPDLNNRLLNVLLRFREHSYAVTGDIEAMYNQIKIPPKDRDALRFIWCDKDGRIVTYRMTSHLFGGVWCSSSSTFALRRTLQDNEASDIVADTVMNSFYVDDCLKSVMSVDEAREVIFDTKDLLSKVGFNITKFLSNDVGVLEEIPVCEQAKEAKEFSSSLNSRVLGVNWDVLQDNFQFKVDIDVVSQLTRRSMLSTMASMFVPLGLASPIVLTGKLLFQEATRLKLSWDECIPSDLLTKWNSWVLSLKSLSLVKVPRCMKPNMFDDSVLELHHFSDAGLKAYGSCSYLRCVNRHGDIHTTLIMSKCKVAPIKSTTIPRLELQAAVLSVQIDSLLRRELSVDIIASHFWTDSELVLKYISNDSSRFHIFVSNRVSVIRQLSDPSQWHHISGKENPADLVTKCQTVDSLDREKWFIGPNFLRTHKSEWQRSEVCDVKLSECDPEVRKASKSSFHVSVESDILESFLQHYSSWYKMKRAVAWLLRLKGLLRGQKVDRGRLTVAEIKVAEIAIISFVQSQFYAREIKTLSSGVSGVSTSSSISSLSPFLDEFGLLRVGGRLKHGPEGVGKHPILVPHKHHIAGCIALECHNVAHLGTEWVTGTLRQKYWITKIRTVVKSVSRKCITCRKLFAPPCAQLMSDLPVERLEPYKVPFTYTGVDCFGPFSIKQGRSELKRYGCIFTCLNTRAVHLEILHSLDTDSFLNAFRRFTARRGPAVKMFSDNGTNFVGGRNELVKSLTELDQSKIADEIVKQGIEWHYNPPTASHIGGVWERLIRTVRKVFAGLFDQKHKMSDEILLTIFCEIEHIINSRPITKLSDDPNSDAALTPAHFLMLCQGHLSPPGVFHDADIYRRRWRFVQHMVDQFWKKWIREYLPELQRRQKWLKIHKNVKMGDLVLITDENTPRYLWPLGLVAKTKEGSDGLVRSVEIKTKSTTFIRPITKIVLLEAAN